MKQKIMPFSKANVQCSARNAVIEQQIPLNVMVDSTKPMRKLMWKIIKKHSSTLATF